MNSIKNVTCNQIPLSLAKDASEKYLTSVRIRCASAEAKSDFQGV